jgi:hypothetical protein
MTFPTTSHPVLAALGLSLFCYSAFATVDSQNLNTTTNVAQYDKTIGDTRVVLLAVASVQILASKGSETNQTYLEITFLSEHIGTNSFRAPGQGSVSLHLQDKENKEKETPLNPDALLNVSTPGTANFGLPPTSVQVSDLKKCYTRRVFFRGLRYAVGSKVNCTIQSGFDGHLADFKFNDILLPCK